MENLRLVTLNVWSNPLNIERRLEVIAESLYVLEPDFVALQEIRQGGPATQVSALAKALGMDWAFGPVEAHSPGGPMGNAVLSKFKIDKSENFQLPSAPTDPRCALKVSARTPYGEVQFTSTHLSWEPELAPRREKQVVALDKFCAAPPYVLSVVAGDFNCSPAAKVVRFMTGLDSLDEHGTFYRDCWMRRHRTEEGITFSSQNPNAVRWIEQDRRLDYIFVRGAALNDGSRTIEDARIVCDRPAADDTWPSDHFGVLAVVRQAPRH